MVQNNPSYTEPPCRSSYSVWNKLRSLQSFVLGISPLWHHRSKSRKKSCLKCDVFRAVWRLKRVLASQRHVRQEACRVSLRLLMRHLCEQSYKQHKKLKTALKLFWLKGWNGKEKMPFKVLKKKKSLKDLLRKLLQNTDKVPIVLQNESIVEVLSAPAFDAFPSSLT